MIVEGTMHVGFDYIPNSVSAVRPLRTYRLFGLTFASELELPDAEPATGTPDVRIHFGDAPQQLVAPVAAGRRWQASPGEALVSLAGIARLYITNGNDVSVAREPGATADDLAFAIMRSAIGPVLHQRRFLVLHASAIHPQEGPAIAVAGPTRSGKSTVLFTSLRRGWRMITDDIAPIAAGASGEVCIWSGSPVVGLWRDTLDHFSVDADRLSVVRSRVSKFNYRSQSGTQAGAHILGAVVLLEQEAKADLRCERLEGRQAFEATRANVRGLGLAEAQDRLGTFERVAAVVNSIPVFRITRPSGDLTAADRIVDTIAEIARKPRTG
jgi:hypothetical protein